MDLGFLTNAPTAILLGTAAIFFIFVLLLYIGSHDLKTRRYANIAVWVFLLTIGITAFYINTDPALAHQINRINHFFGGMVAAGFFLFTLSYEEKTSRALRAAVILFETALLALYLFSDLIIAKTVLSTENVFRHAWEFGTLGFLFQLNYLGFFALSFKKLLNAREGIITTQEREEINSIIFASALGAVAPTTVGLILPALGIFHFFWLTPMAGLIWFASTMYIVIKNHTFNVKIIASVILFLILIFLSFINIFIG